MAPVDVSTQILGFSFPIQLIRPSNQLWAWLQTSAYGTLPIVLCRINHYSIPLLAHPPIRALEPVPNRNRHPLIQKNPSKTTDLGIYYQRVYRNPKISETGPLQANNEYIHNRDAIHDQTEPRTRAAGIENGNLQLLHL